MQKLAELCVRRPVFAAVLILILVVVGSASFFRLGVDRFPEIDFPTVTVVTTLPGSSPEAVETEITKKIEDAVGTLSGIDELRSSSSEGVSTVTITFVLEKNVDVAAQEVRDKVALAQRDLPKDVDPPTVRRFDPSQIPIMSLAVSADRPIGQVTEYADKTLRRQIESANGVGEVNLRGGQIRQVNIWLDAYKLRSVNLTVNDVTKALQSQNIEVPGGDVDQGARKLTLRTLGRLTTIKQFNDIVLRAQGGGQVLLSDVARVDDGLAEATSYSELNGKATVQLAVLKQSGTNTLAVVDAVLERLKEAEASAPSGTKIRVVSEQSSYIKAAVSSVEEHLLLGAVLAAAVVLIFLWNWRATLITAVAIPASIISTFTLMYAMGFTLNLITLLALTLSVGIVIDDAIVVLENIFRHMDEFGKSAFEAAIDGTREIGLAVLATTLSLVAVFLPVAFMSGIVGRFMNSFGLTMSFAIMISLLVAFTLTPMLSSRWLKGKGDASAAAVADGMDAPMSASTRIEDRDTVNGPYTPSQAEIKEAHSAQAHGTHSHSAKDGGSRERGFFAAIDRFYTMLLHFALKRRWVIVLIAFAAIGSMVPLFKLGLVPFNFLPTDDESQFQIAIEAPQGTSLEAVTKAGRRVTDLVKKEIPNVDYTLMTAGSGNENEASVYVRLTGIETREISQDDAVAMARAKIAPVLKAQGLLVSVAPINSFNAGGGRRGAAQIQYVLSGPDLNVLREASLKAVTQMRAIPGIVEPDTNLVLGKPEIDVKVNRELAQQLGVSPADIAGTLRFLVGGDKVTDYNEGGEQYEVHVRADRQFRDAIAGIGLLTVPSTTAGSVPLEQLVTFERGTGPATIERLNRQRQVTLLANTIPGSSQAAIVADLEKVIKGLNLGPDYQASPVGTAKEQAKTGKSFMLALGLSLVFMYLVLAAQFESWLHPITILLSLPLTVPFAFWSLALFGQSINIFSMLGILVLFGVVKKNAILQIDHTNKLREAGMNRYDAIVQGNRDRLRPILMTTLAFVAGMLPLILSRGVGSGTNHAIGSVIFGGQTLSLGLTLLATPVAYSLFDDLANYHPITRLRRFVGKFIPALKPPTSALQNMKAEN